jgi:hypothetical protein
VSASNCSVHSLIPPPPHPKIKTKTKQKQKQNTNGVPEPEPAGRDGGPKQLHVRESWGHLPFALANTNTV